MAGAYNYKGYEVGGISQGINAPPYLLNINAINQKNDIEVLNSYINGEAFTFSDIGYKYSGTGDNNADDVYLIGNPNRIIRNVSWGNDVGTLPYKGSFKDSSDKLISVLSYTCNSNAPAPCRDGSDYKKWNNANGATIKLRPTKKVQGASSSGTDQYYVPYTQTITLTYDAEIGLTITTGTGDGALNLSGISSNHIIIIDLQAGGGGGAATGGDSVSILAVGHSNGGGGGGSGAFASVLLDMSKFSSVTITSDGNANSSSGGTSEGSNGNKGASLLLTGTYLNGAKQSIAVIGGSGGRGSDATVRKSHMDEKPLYIGGGSGGHISNKIDGGSGVTIITGTLFTNDGVSGGEGGCTDSAVNSGDGALKGNDISFTIPQDGGLHYFKGMTLTNTGGSTYGSTDNSEHLAAGGGGAASLLGSPGSRNSENQDPGVGFGYGGTGGYRGGRVVTGENGTSDSGQNGGEPLIILYI